MDNRTTILQELKEISPLIAGIDPVNPYSVPYLYFEGLERKVQEIISEPEELPAFLSDLKAGNSMTVPAGFFSSFPEQVLQKIREEEKPEENAGAKLIQMPTRRRNYFQWAAAAVTVGIVVLAVFFFTGRNRNTTTASADIDQFSIETLESFVEGESIPTATSMAVTSVDIKAEDMLEVMDEFSEETLQHYLNTQNGNLETQVN